MDVNGLVCMFSHKVILRSRGGPVMPVSDDSIDKSAWGSLHAHAVRCHPVSSLPAGHHHELRSQGLHRWLRPGKRWEGQRHASAADLAGLVIRQRTRMLDAKVHPCKPNALCPLHVEHGLAAAIYVLLPLSLPVLLQRLPASGCTRPS